MFGIDTEKHLRLFEERIAKLESKVKSLEKDISDKTNLWVITPRSWFLTIDRATQMGGTQMSLKDCMENLIAYLGIEFVEKPGVAPSVEIVKKPKEASSAKVASKR